MTWLAGLSAIVTGLTDFKDTATGDERHVVGLHGLINIVATASCSAPSSRSWARPMRWRAGCSSVGYLVLSVGAFIGGHVVFKYGYMVNFNAFAKRRRRRRSSPPSCPRPSWPRRRPPRRCSGTTGLVLVRRGDLVFALKETCSHAGGPLAAGQAGWDTHRLPVAWVGLPAERRRGAARSGDRAAGRLSRPDQRRPGGGPGSDRLAPAIRAVRYPAVSLPSTGPRKDPRDLPPHRRPR